MLFWGGLSYTLTLWYQIILFALYMTRCDIQANLKKMKTEFILLKATKETENHHKHFWQQTKQSKFQNCLTFKKLNLNTP